MYSDLSPAELALSKEDFIAQRAKEIVGLLGAHQHTGVVTALNPSFDVELGSAEIVAASEFRMKQKHTGDPYELIQALKAAGNDLPKHPAKSLAKRHMIHGKTTPIPDEERALTKDEYVRRRAQKIEAVINTTGESVTIGLALQPTLMNEEHNPIIQQDRAVERFQRATRTLAAAEYYSGEKHDDTPDVLKAALMGTLRYQPHPNYIAEIIAGSGGKVASLNAFRR